jgi:hypothetical protein
MKFYRSGIRTDSMKTDKDKKDNVQWETIEALESIANQCIYKGKEVAKARALLKSLYQKDVSYDDETTCSHESPEEETE